jgi:mannosyltransferase
MGIDSRPKPVDDAASPRQVRLLIGALVCLALVLRAAFLGDREVFRDEAASWITASFSFTDLIARVAHEAYPPLYPALLKLWMLVFGEGLASLRFVSVIAGLAVVVVGWRWAHEACGWKVGLVALALLALSPLAITESRDARMYALESAFAVTSWWLAWRLVADRAQGRSVMIEALGLGLAVSAELWTSDYGIPTAALQLIAVAIASRSKAPGRSNLAFVAIAAGAVSFLPWAPSLLSLTTGSASFWTPRPDIWALLDTPSVWITDGYGSLATDLGRVAVVGAIAGLLISGYGASEQTATGARQYRLFAILSLAILPIVWLGSQVHPAYDTRYFGALLPALAGGVGVIVVRASGAKTVRIRDSWMALPFTFLLLVAVVSVSTWRTGSDIAPASDVATTLAGEMRPGDVVIAVDARSYFPMAYVAERRTDPVRLPGPVLCWNSGMEPYFYGTALVPESATVYASSNLRAQLPELGPNGRIWLVALANGTNADIGFAPLIDGSVRQLSELILHPKSNPGQIRQLVLSP